MKLSDCTSTRCNNYNCDYCPRCSHAIYSGSATIDGRRYTWRHNPYHGPLFECKAIRRANWIPHARHKVWAAYARWAMRLPTGGKA
jgi:hypothetical protein